MLKTAAVACACIAAQSIADPILTDSLTSDSGSWMTTSGNWSFSDAGLQNTGGGENRIFQDALNGQTSYAVEFTGTLHQSQGWGVWLSAGLDPHNHVSGYTFQYDPGWNPDSYLLRRWNDNHESVLMQVDLDVDYDQAHQFRLEVDDGDFRAYEDNVLVMAFADLTEHDGNLIGFRTWASSLASFQNLSVTTTVVPTPGAASAGLACLGLAAFVRGAGSSRRGRG